MKSRETKINTLSVFGRASLPFVLLFLLTAGVSSGCSGCKEPSHGTIVATAVDPKLTPIRGVSVTLTSRQLSLGIKSTTSPEGTCTFPSLPVKNDYTVKFEKEGFISKTREYITVSGGKKTLIRVSLNINTEIIPGRWLVAKPHIKNDALPGKLKEKMRKLETLSYLAGHKIAPGAKNVTLYDEKRAFKGLNLYCSGHGPEAILMDMKGKPLHRWRYPIHQVWKKKYDPQSFNHLFWRRVHLMENGDLLAIFEGHGLIKLDKSSNLTWSYPGNAHHDLFVMPDGRIYVLTRKGVLNPRYNKTEPILDEFIVILSSRGKELRRVSLLKCLENSTYVSLPAGMNHPGDLLHTNTIEVLDGKLAYKSPAFKRGNVLVSILNLDLIAVVNMEKESVVWAMSGMWKRQHQPSVLDNGNMLIFDNQFGSNPMVSRVLEFNPFTGQILWEYRGNADMPFFTGDCGSCQRLGNGNTLISETNTGRAFEVTPDKTVVWEFYNPHRAGKNNELIASLFEVVRIDPAYNTGWLND